MTSEPSQETSPRSTYRLMAAVAIAILVLLSVAIFSLSRMQTLPWASGLRRPEFSTTLRKPLPEIQGVELLSQANLSGKWTLISFWSVTCEPCLRELPSMDQFLINWQGPEFQIVTVNVDRERAEDFDAARKFLMLSDISLPAVFDTGERLKKAFAVTEYPKHFLVNPAGQIVWEAVGAYAWNEASVRDQLLKLTEQEVPQKDSSLSE